MSGVEMVGGGGDGNPNGSAPSPVQYVTMSADLGETASDNDSSAHERSLVERVRSGDTSAFDALVRRHVESALAAALRILRNQADAEDAVQDAFIRALDRIHLFDVTRPFGPWLHRMVVNTAINNMRARTVREVEPEALDAPAPRSDPHEHAEQEEIRRLFAAAVDRLSERQRLAVVLYDVEGFSTQEIAERMQVSQETVRGHIHLARKALRAALSGFRSEPG
jgi:RNA polymerase sigma-70 factor (ECF subfamily)